jgi:hypothetical protein
MVPHAVAAAATTAGVPLHTGPACSLHTPSWGAFIHSRDSAIRQGAAWHARGAGCAPVRHLHLAPPFLVEDYVPALVTTHALGRMKVSQLCLGVAFPPP